jgi:hypothetical protein
VTRNKQPAAKIFPLESLVSRFPPDVPRADIYGAFGIPGIPGMVGIVMPFGRAGIPLGIPGIPTGICGIDLRCAAAILADSASLPHSISTVVCVCAAMDASGIAVPLLSRLPALPVASAAEIPVVSVAGGRLEVLAFCASTAAWSAQPLPWQYSITPV